MVYVPGVAALPLIGLNGETVKVSDPEVSGHAAGVDVVTVVSPVPFVVFVNDTLGTPVPLSGRSVADASLKKPEPVAVTDVGVADGLSSMLETVMALSVGAASTVMAAAAVSVPASSTTVKVPEPAVAVADVE
jgi:hypothetical protein